MQNVSRVKSKEEMKKIAKKVLNNMKWEFNFKMKHSPESPLNKGTSSCIKAK